MKILFTNEDSLINADIKLFKILNTLCITAVCITAIAKCGIFGLLMVFTAELISLGAKI